MNLSNSSNLLINKNEYVWEGEDINVDIGHSHAPIENADDVQLIDSFFTDYQNCVLFKTEICFGL